MTFPDDFTFVGITTKPRTQFELDQLTRQYKAGETTEEDVLVAIGLPAIGDAHPLFSTMFVVGLDTTETGEKAVALDVKYVGMISGGLPAIHHSSNGEISSATSNTSSIIFPVTATNPATVTFYAITNMIVTWSTTTTSADEPDTPPDVSALITWDLGFGVQPGLSIPAVQAFLLANVFVQGTVEMPPTVAEIVAGKYYQITKRKTRTLWPYGPPS